MEMEKKYAGGWWVWILILTVLTVIVLAGLNAVGLFGKTVVERVIFEESYQRKAGDSAKLATFRAQRASLQRQLQKQGLTATQRSDFEAQLAAIEIQIATVKGQ